MSKLYFHTYSSEELNIHVKKKQSSCQKIFQVDEKYDQQLPKTHLEKVSLKIYVQKTVNIKLTTINSFSEKL